MAGTYEIRLVVSRSGDGYTARWIEPGGQESESFSLVLPLTAANMADLRWYLEKYYQYPGAGDRARAQGIELKLTDWGRDMFNALFGTSEGTHVYRTLMDAAESRHPCLLTIGIRNFYINTRPFQKRRQFQTKSHPSAIFMHKQAHLLDAHIFARSWLVIRVKKELNVHW